MANWFEKFYWNTYTVLESRGDRRLPFRPLDEVLALQRRRLCAMVAHAYRHVPFYARSMREAGLRPEDIRTASDLEKLPIIDAEQLSRDPRQFQSVPLNPRRCLRVYSSGTSGKPKEIYHDAPSLFMHMAHQQRKHAAAAHFLGRRHGYREMNALPPCATNFQLRDFYRDFCWMPGGIDMCRGMLPVNTSFAENLRAIDEFQPDLIKGLGSYIGALFRWAWSRKQKFSLPKLILYGADHMPDADRALIEGEFGIPVLSSYQAVEAMHIAFQCEQRQGFHLNLDLVAVRTVDAAGRTLPPGQSGDIVISNLTNRATVLLNYGLGDRVKISAEPCPCGRSLPVIEKIEGRSDDLIARPDGSRVFYCYVLDAVQALAGVLAIQIIQKTLQSFRIRIVATPDCDRDSLQPRIIQVLMSILGGDIRVQTEFVDSLNRDPGQKVKGVISHVPYLLQ